MNCRLALCFTVAAPLLSSAQQAADEPPFKKEEVHALIREVAAKVEEKYKSVHPEADGLVQRVEETLAAPEPPKANEDDRQQMLAKEMMLMNFQAGFNSLIGGVRGAVFDNTDTGYMQRYQDLESASTRDAEEVWRWLEMADAAKHLKWKDKEETCTQRALGAARALVSREPKNAEAHTLQGLALEWSGEKLTALQTALKLDPGQPLALNVLLQRRMEQVLEAAALRQGIRLEEKPRDVTRALFDRPLTEEETAAFERQMQELHSEMVRLFALAQKRGDLSAYLHTVNLRNRLRIQRDEVAAAAKRGQDESFEMFQSRLRSMMINSVFRLFDDDTLLQTALRLAAADPETTGSIILMSLIGDSIRTKTEGWRPAESHMEIIHQTFGRLLEMAHADDSLRAARAAEAASLMEFGLLMGLNQKPSHLDLLLRAVHLDPFRQRTQHMLMGLCMGFSPKATDPAAVAALSFTELALLPSLQTRRTCAAAAAKVHDWTSAHRLLDTCLREHPDDLGLLNQKAVTLLRESQSKAAQKKAATYFHKIESLAEKHNPSPDDPDLKLFVRDHILFLMMGGKNEEARRQLAKLKDENILDEKERQELEKLLP